MSFMGGSETARPGRRPGINAQTARLPFEGDAFSPVTRFSMRPYRPAVARRPDLHVAEMKPNSRAPSAARSRPPATALSCRNRFLDEPDDAGRCRARKTAIRVCSAPIFPPLD